MVTIIYLPLFPVRPSDPAVRALEDAAAIREVVRALNALAYG